MLKYTEAEVVFKEVPDEITLAINISGCPIHCPGCHSKYLWEDVGEDLGEDTLENLIKKNPGITCVSFMGGDSDPSQIDKLSKYIKNYFPDLKVSWYSGREKISCDINLENFDYIKIGPYKKEFGPINNPNTNQKLYVKGKHLHKMDANSNMWYDITDKF